MRIIGLISGTSIDAIDAALVEIKRDEHVLHLDVKAFRMQPWDEALRERLRGLMPPDIGSTAAVCELNVLAGEAFAHAARRLAEDAGTGLDAVDLIASHGQTVYHQVAPGATRSTLQLGAAAVIAERTGCTVAADFQAARHGRRRRGSAAGAVPGSAVAARWAQTSRVSEYRRDRQRNLCAAHRRCRSPSTPGPATC